MYKTFYYYGRKYKLSDEGDLIRCEYTDVRIQKYNGKCIKLKRLNKEKHIKPFEDKDGYLDVTLHSNKHSRHFRVHHLVYIVYTMNIVNLTNKNYIGYQFDTHSYTQINHIDGNKKNNIHNNLELCTLQHNIGEACRIGIHNSQTKAVYVEIYRNNKLLTTVWKTRTACDYIKNHFGLKINSGTLSRYARASKEWKGFTFKYIKKCNDYRKV